MAYIVRILLSSQSNQAKETIWPTDNKNLKMSQLSEKESRLLEISIIMR
jgi:hypothetical protein